MKKLITAGLFALILGSSATAMATVHQDRVSRGDTDVYEMTFRRGQQAEIAVIGDGDTDLDLRVYDEDGNLVASDTDETDRCYASWRPRWTGKFRVEIENLGDVSNRYSLTKE